VVTPVPVAAEILRSDAWWMLASVVALLPLMRIGRNVTRVEGALLLGAYGVYLAQLFVRGSPGA
jgi:cation:H+ antiporter